MKLDHLSEPRAKILAQVLRNAPFDGWDHRALARATLAAGYDRTMAQRAFPGGAGELIGAYMAATDQRMVAACGKRNLAELKIRERIAVIVQIRLELMRRDREAIRRAVSTQLAPWRGMAAAKQLARTVDAMWYLAGDTAHDFNWYTKRALLATVFASTLVFWLQDESENFQETWAFLERRIAAVMGIQKLRGKLEKRLGNLPNPWRLAARLRYGGKLGCKSRQSRQGAVESVIGS